MTYREWTRTYGGTYATISFAAMGACIILSKLCVPDPFWLRALVGILFYVVVLFGLSALAWQITERRRRRTETTGSR